MEINRIVLIGNGFDLAHKLPTSYQDFIRDYWSSIGHKISEQGSRKIVLKDELLHIQYNESWTYPYKEEDKIQSYKEFKKYSLYFSEKCSLLYIIQNLFKILFKISLSLTEITYFL